MRNKILMTLALLLTAVTGAWAQSSLNVVKLEVPAEWATDENPVTAADLPGFKAVNLEEAQTWTGAPAEGNAMLFYAFDGDKINVVNYSNGKEGSNGKAELTKKIVFSIKSNVKFYYTAEPAAPAAEPAEPAIDFKWDAAKKTGTFTMPDYDVEIAPIYAPVAQWAKVEDVDQLPTAIEGVIADTDAPLIVEGTVAFAGTSTEVKQGTVMYAVTPATVTEAPALDAANKWSADVPTAKLVADGGVDVKVWYYIKGADTPKDEEATAENTFNDSEICTEPITVTVLSNKFDIEFKAANANTIEAEKATVTVGGTAKTVTEGKLTGVKMGSEVKVKAKDGYKFRKVEAKKGGLLSIVIGGATTATIYYVEGETWAQAMENHPEENAAWGTDPDGDITGNGHPLFAGDDFVNSNSIINPNAGYTFGWT